MTPLLLRLPLVLLGLAALTGPARALPRQSEESASGALYAYRYLLYLPSGYSEQPGQRWPLMVFLHGSGQVGNRLASVADNGPPQLIEAGRDYPCIVVSPQTTANYWNDSSVDAFIADLTQRYSVDADRIYLTGLSLGGYGTWAAAIRNPERYAAVVPLCGGGNPTQAYRLRDLPLWNFHGALDNTVGPGNSVAMIDAIRAAGGAPLFTLYADLGHDVWTRTYARDDLYAWLFSQTRRTVPVIDTPPVALTRSTGQSANFSVAAHGRGPLEYFWRRDGTLLSTTGPTLNLAALTVADAGDYSVLVRNAGGEVSSSPITLTVQSPPSIAVPPVSLVAAAGEDVFFQVVASGGDLTYSWSHADTVITGADQPALRLAHLSPADAGAYSVTIRNPRGTLVSAPANLTLAPDDHAPRLVNLSARANAGSGDETLIIGLSIGGGDSPAGLPVLLRGIGPGLVPLGVASALPDPALTVFSGGTPLLRNADWRGAPLISATAARLGAFALDPASLDAAVFTTLHPQNYTMHLGSGRPGAGAPAMVECYDAGGGTSPHRPRLLNLSARASAGSGDATLIAGFVVAGSGPLRVLVRGIGPGLAAQGVNGVLADPQLRLYRGGTAQAQNDDWANDPALRAAFAQTGAFGLAADSKDAALLVTLPPGVYSAHVTGKNSLTGVALVEIYVVP